MAPVNHPLRRPRLTSIKDPKAAGGMFPPKRPPPSAAAPTPPPRKPTHRKCCDNQILSDEDGQVVCENCGTRLASSSLTSELTFGENAAGGATVVGGYVADDQRHANSMGGTAPGLGGGDSRRNTENNGNNAIRALCSQLNLPESIETQARNWYKLGLNHNFVQGRRIMNVAAVVIYFAARRRRECTLMLMDLSEKVRCSVWELGRTYKDFLRLMMEEDPEDKEGYKDIQQMEPLMLKFCRKLEFGEDSHRVAADACRVMRRMSRDWMVQGRNPAGICGACIIIGARMNNFRRTVRETVYVVRVADSTINSRLYEYKRSGSSALTVRQFREFGERLKPEKEPPAIWRRAEREAREAERKERRENGQKRSHEGEEADHDGASDDEFDGGSDVSSNTGQARTKVPETRAIKKRKLNNGKTKDTPPATNSSNSDSLLNLDIDALQSGDVAENLDALAENQLNGENVVKPKKRGRPPKKREQVIIPDEDLEIEAEIEHEIEATIADWQSTFKEFAENENHEVLVKAGDRAREIAAQQMPDKGVSNVEEIGEDEFEDDPDVATCILAEHEVRNKERIWLSMNEDWLRAQQAKLLAKLLEDAQGKPKKPIQRRKRTKLGDGSVLGGRPADSPADAAHKMVEKHGKHFSSVLNYEKIQSLLVGGGSTSSGATTPNGSAVAGASPPSAESTGPSAAPTPLQKPPTPANEDLEEEDEEEYEEEEVEEPLDDEDLENEHMYDDDDEGFGNANYDDY
ncbi:hypothetical protein DM02DRAFT_608901 [Periconia macrospinosa]|uniref:Cyclin-like domain-containing protein n=1 Tax=Periconia macrospinosa TaxID=97972 RepID=A0A2V1EA02_9PLEO|nr:hypothetical protein DM02DRAFT_608901 [Periconia macrospinosa]